LILAHCFTFSPVNVGPASKEVHAMTQMEKFFRNIFKDAKTAVTAVILLVIIVAVSWFIAFTVAERVTGQLGIINLLVFFGLLYFFVYLVKKWRESKDVQ
jgi:hypothetical protein